MNQPSALAQNTLLSDQLRRVREDVEKLKIPFAAYAGIRVRNGNLAEYSS